MTDSLLLTSCVALSSVPRSVKGGILLSASHPEGLDAMMPIRPLTQYRMQARQIRAPSFAASSLAESAWEPRVACQWGQHRCPGQ